MDEDAVKILKKSSLGYLGHSWLIKRQGREVMSDEHRR